MSRPPEKSALRHNLTDAAILAACALTIAWGIGGYGLYEPHEAHYAGIGREALLRGDWVVPHLNGAPYLNKPPLMYWSIAAAYAAAGRVTEAAARAPGAIYGWLGVVCAWLWARRLWGRAAGQAAALTLTASFGWFIFTRQIMTDILVASLHLWTLYFAWRCICAPERRGWWPAFYLALSAAMMAKGPPGVLFSLLALVGWMAISRRWDIIKKSGWPWGAAIVILPVAIWALLVESRCPGFLRHAILNEIIYRIADKRWPPDYQVSSVSALGYLIVAAVWCGPWSLLAPQVARFVRGQMSGAGVPPVIQGDGTATPESSDLSDSDSREAESRRAAIVVLALGALGPVIVFLPMPSRLVYYCLPSVPPFAVLCAGWLMAPMDSRASERWLRAAGALFLAVGAAVLSAPLWVGPLVEGVPEMQKAPTTLKYITPMALLLGAGFCAGGAGMLLKRPLAAAIGLFIPFALGFMMAANGFRAFEDIRSSRNMMADYAARLGPDAVWISEGSKELGASAGIEFYLGEDATGQARVVLVMDDDERRPQPSFGAAPRDYAITRERLNEIWPGDLPAAFVTDMMRQSFEKDPPRLPESAGEIAAEHGFRRLYLNQAAWAKLRSP